MALLNLGINIRKIWLTNTNLLVTKTVNRIDLEHVSGVGQISTFICQRVHRFMIGSVKKSILCHVIYVIQPLCFMILRKRQFVGGINVKISMTWRMSNDQASIYNI